MRDIYILMKEGTLTSSSAIYMVLLMFFGPAVSASTPTSIPNLVVNEVRWLRSFVQSFSTKSITAPSHSITAPPHSVTVPSRVDSPNLGSCFCLCSTTERLPCLRKDFASLANFSQNTCGISVEEKQLSVSGV
ncbi:hypothetical protein VNO80_11514 [Phaseolus coccineus]|uniref:Uncharacterized protein n=1 Tax=Phaseolus coccineus TaxID=3886 RepID=A0AAN9NAI6_PHACN